MAEHSALFFLSSPLFILYLLLSLTSTPIAAQNGTLYQPVTYSASAILSDGGFYIYGGVTVFRPGLQPNVGTSQFLRVDLTQSFNTTAPPWTTLSGYNTYTMIDASPSRDGKQFILGGNRDNIGTLSYIYDVDSARWIAAPDLPGMASAMSTYKRGNVGMALDSDTGLIYIYGGFHGCAALNTAYLVSGGSSVKTLSIQTQALSIGPSPRYLSCRVVLGDGNIFIQGGKDPNNFFGDAWILSISNWTWTQITINGPSAEMTRAGHTCQMGPNGQVVLVGGFITVANVSTFVTPYMAVIDTKTWTWTTGYKGAPLDSIWTNVPLVDDVGDVGGVNGVSSKSGLSGGVKGAIGAVAVIAVLGIALGFFLWRRKKLSSKNNNVTDSKLSQTPSTVEKAQRPSRHDNSDNVHHLVAIDSAKTSPTTAASHIELIPRGQQYVVQDNEGSGSLISEPITTATLTTLPQYSGSLDSPLMNTIEKPRPFTDSSAFNASGPMNDTALAAAMFLAEDKSSRTPSASKPGTPSLSNLKQVLPPSPTVADAARTPESFIPGAKYTEPPLQPQLSPSSLLKQTPDPVIPPRTIHTPVVNTLMTAGSPARSAPGPQSVPEQEAKIERFSPGVKTHVFTPQDLNPDGLYPPLTPTRPPGTHSILVGTPASAVPPNASSFSTITSSLKFTPGSEAGSFTAGSRHLGPDRRQDQEHDPDHPDASKQIPYRDPQMMKDLVDIAKLIESQTLAEFKNPHAVVKKED
ncbi:hypothetical protein BGZ80_011620 [Entomortierella chlamydospora]|uniref:Galactose oxidase n=1 Tax=Entomortierella chlamydospora TaxID=101097 RepID=A0A9P6SYX0_9FUNG|nr:hypothetical protein BGZ80_011620 [Entomortierella chlamydospora]